MLYAHDGSGNHGCEAIVRGTVKILSEIGIPKCLSSLNPQEDEQYDIQQIIPLLDHRPHEHFSRIEWLSAAIWVKTVKTLYLHTAYRHRNIIGRAHPGMVALSIGGDNYCYKDREWLYHVNRLLNRRGAKTVLWGCSIEPATMDAAMLKDLQRYTLITPRESITGNALQEKGLQNVRLHPDPAFRLDTVELPLPPRFVAGNTIGINVSPLIMWYEKAAGSVFKAYRDLIQHIITTTDLQIALIPHVVWASNNDLEPLEKLQAEFQSTGRVILLPDHNCMELKGFISRCRMFIGARTHATIAAYSTHVPTLVVGYSVKARGIARDIFGDEKDLILPVQELATPGQLIDAFEKLQERENDLRTHLQTFIPGYAAKAAEATNDIQELFSQ